MTMRNRQSQSTIIVGESGGKQSKDMSSTYQNETSEPSYLCSSIYYGGQDVYPPNIQTKTTHHAMKKDHVGGDDFHTSLIKCYHQSYALGSIYSCFMAVIIGLPRI